MKRFSFMLLGMLILASGCATINTTAATKGSIVVASGKKAYVIRHEKSTKDIDLYIKEALIELGFAAVSGPVEQMPSDVDIYVKYSDKWMWDLGMYLLTLDISVYDKQTGSLLKSASFMNSPFHTGHAETWTKKTVKKAFQD